MSAKWDDKDGWKIYHSQNDRDQIDEDRVTSLNHPELVGKQVSKNCPNGHPFKVRRNKDDDSLFLGCSKFPECRETSEIPLDLLLKLTGTKGLFD